MALFGAGRLGVRLGFMAAAVVAICMAPLGGCQKNAGGPGPTRADGAPLTAYDLYTARKYEPARAAAEADHRKSDGRAREIAALTAGLSCHALGRTAEAQTWLTPLSTSTYPEIAGRADATLGLIAHNSGEHAKAADLLVKGAGRLSGDTAARTWVRAGHSYTALKRYPDAKRCYDAAFGAAKTPALKGAIQPYTAAGPFAVQVGVFTSKPNADRKANEVAPAASRLGIGQPRVLPETVSGKGAFAVRLGSFPNRHAAALACGQLGMQACVVEPN
jgi:tetratricopeptide (TPR) repeat protein